MSRQQEFFRKCVDFHASFDEKASEEYLFMALSFKEMAEKFPIQFGDTLTNPKFWQKFQTRLYNERQNLVLNSHAVIS